MTRITNKPAFLIAGAVLLAAAAWLAFGFFGIQSAFIDNEVSEAGPVFAAAVTEEVEAPQEEQVTVAPSQESQDAAASEETQATEASAAPVTTTAAPVEAAPEIVTLLSGQFTGESRYDVSGDALVLNDGSEQRFLRFENFAASNGPDLKVYLRADNGDFVNLGELKGNIGDQNYEIPADVDLDVFNTVDIWCERFSVGFGGATLA